ncbi:MULTISPECIES: hypothetical protein [Bacillus]|jgi:hypothetical protein|nr:hypothetical protein [Bacillus pseudomycoides]EEM13985.1 hypothetical protein bpmyx0001_51510 [Bacillus pseudomycoides DSM 12442]MDR4918955.1 hypothetical protein [Bacillus pseudomycoides]MED1478243.1 hypothetical protein [Bacillus pseudomycoides]MED1599161.1 hypothetical protein [Bacillus pseudomycoides]MED4652394.1 hypothetical protein [Bacillus pseudomycoides]
MNLSIHGELQPFAEELQRYTVSKGIPKGTPFGITQINANIAFQNIKNIF